MGSNFAYDKRAGLILLFAALFTTPIALRYEAAPAFLPLLLGAGAGALLMMRLGGERGGCSVTQAPLRAAPARAPAVQPETGSVRSGQRVEDDAEQDGRPTRAPGGFASVFLQWYDGLTADNDPWIGFDQLLREMLGQQVHAGRVRCFRVCETSGRLYRLAEGQQPNEEPITSALLQHVAATGRVYIERETRSTDALRDLAEEDGQRWDWVFPLRSAGRTRAVIAVARLEGLTLAPAVRQRIVDELTVLWRLVESSTALRSARQLDHSSGVLTRREFFQEAGRTLSASRELHEPAVIAVIGIEGLRRLDDAGRWQERDALIESIGQLLSQRIRSDDLVGRFSDDRFVVLLRRLDGGLGRLITQKMLSAVQKLTETHAADDVSCRAGLLGTEFRDATFEALLSGAFAALDEARRNGVQMHCDFEAPPAEGI